MSTNLRTCAILGVVGLAVLCGSGRADSLLVGQRQWSNVKIQWVQDGKVRFTASDGTQQAVPIATVSRLQVDLRDDLNRGEQLRSEGKAAEAVAAYEAALRSESRNDLGGFIRYRLMDLYGRSGQLDLAVEMFLDLIKQTDFYATIKDWRPENLAAAKPKTREAALTALAEGVRQIRTGLASESVGQLRDYIQANKAAPAGEAASAGSAAKPSAATTAKPSAAPAGKPSVAEDEAADAPAMTDSGEPAWAGVSVLQRGQYDQALQAANQALGQPDLPHEQLADVLYVRGVAQWQVARTPAQTLQAGWALARLLVEFPTDPRVGECQYYLGLVHQRLGQATQARQLLQQAQQNAGASADLRERAKKALRDVVDKG